jgi:hypothetical protein
MEILRSALVDFPAMAAEQWQLHPSETRESPRKVAIAIIQREEELIQVCD